MEKIINEAFDNYYSHEQKHYNVNNYSKPFTYSYHNNYIKGYNVNDKQMEKAIALYPKINQSPYYSNIANSVNAYLLKVNITDTISFYKLFTDPKKLTSYCNNVYARVKKLTCHYMFLIPEMNNAYTVKQLNWFCKWN